MVPTFDRNTKITSGGASYVCTGESKTNREPLRFGILRSSRAATTRTSPVPGKFARFFDRQYPIVRFAQAYISRPTYDFKTLEPFV